MHLLYFVLVIILPYVSFCNAFQKTFTQFSPFRKPSLYNHFKSKEEIIAAMYQYLREKSKEQLSLADIDYGEFIKEKSMEEALAQSVENYSSISTESKMLSFYKIIFLVSSAIILAAVGLTERSE